MQAQSYNNGVALMSRKPQFVFPEDTPSDWFDANPVLSQMLNVYTVLVPDNERFYMRTLRQCLALVDDPALKQLIIDFCHQEQAHGVGHEAYWPNLRRQGLRFTGFVRWVSFISYRIPEAWFSLRLRVAIVAAIEHVNAYLGHIFLANDLLRDADPELTRLFSWHFAEEIEHKAVAHDVLQALNVGYFTRLAGALLVVPLFYGFSFLGLLYFLKQTRQLTHGAAWRRAWRFWFVKEKVVWKSLGFLWAYVRPGFQPWELDDYALAQAWFARESLPLADPLN